MEGAAHSRAWGGTPNILVVLSGRYKSRLRKDFRFFERWWRIVATGWFWFPRSGGVHQTSEGGGLFLGLSNSGLGPASFWRLGGLDRRVHEGGWFAQGTCREGMGMERGAQAGRWWLSPGMVAFAGRGGGYQAVSLRRAYVRAWAWTTWAWSAFAGHAGFRRASQTGRIPGDRFGRGPPEPVLPFADPTSGFPCNNLGYFGSTRYL